MDSSPSRAEQSLQDLLDRGVVVGKPTDRFHRTVPRPFVWMKEEDGGESAAALSPPNPERFEPRT